MNHWIIAPVLLPAVLAAVQTLTMRHHPLLQRVFSLVGVGTVLAMQKYDNRLPVKFDKEDDVQRYETEEGLHHPLGCQATHVEQEVHERRERTARAAAQ